MIVAGNVTYRPRIALPPDAVVRVTVEDVSRADAPSTTLADTTINTDRRQVPIPFSISVDRSRLEAGHRYAVRAQILDNSGALMWTTDTVHPVDADSEAVNDLELVVVQVAETEAEDNQLAGSSWQLTGITSLNGTSLKPAAGEEYTIAFDREGRFNGQADCNRFGGEYTVQPGNGLTLERALSTMAACAPPSLDNEFMSVLNAVTAFDMTTQRLRLTTSSAGALEFSPRAGG